MSQNRKCTLYVSGMHCGSCEVLIEKKLRKLEGVSAVRASLTHKIVDVEYSKGHHPNIEHLNNSFADLGYSFSEAPTGVAKFNFQSVVTFIGISIVALILFFIIEDTQFVSQISLNDSSPLLAFFALGVIASISTCAALVGGLVLSLSKQWNELYGGKNENKRILPFVMFNTGRIISYALLGGLLGILGSFFTVTLQQSALLIIVVSVLMLVLALQMLGVPGFKGIRIGLPRFISKYITDEQNFAGKYMPFTAGALTFFIPCGFTLMAQSVALATGNFFSSMLMMLAFALGTLPVLAIISFSSIKFQKNSLYSGTFNLIAGLFILIFGIYNINAQLNVLGAKNLSDLRSPSVSAQSEPSGVEVVEDGNNKYQRVTLTAEGFQYLPRELQLQSGVPVKMTINSNGVLGCAQAMYLPGLYNDVVYLNAPVKNIEFTPEKVGTYKISCTMGMVPPVIVKVI